MSGSHGEIVRRTNTFKFKTGLQRRFGFKLATAVGANQPKAAEACTLGRRRPMLPRRVLLSPSPSQH